MKRVFYAFAALALLSVAISLGGKWFGRSIAMAGYTDDTTVHEVVIGNNVIAVPANIIRFEQARRDGIASRLDLYLRYPEMDGYSEAARDDFNHTGSAQGHHLPVVRAADDVARHERPLRADLQRTDRPAGHAGPGRHDAL